MMVSFHYRLQLRQRNTCWLRVWQLLISWIIWLFQYKLVFLRQVECIVVFGYDIPQRKSIFGSFQSQRTFWNFILEHDWGVLFLDYLFEGWRVQPIILVSVNNILDFLIASDFRATERSLRYPVKLFLQVYHSVLDAITVAFGYIPQWDMLL